MRKAEEINNLAIPESEMNPKLVKLQCNAVVGDEDFFSRFVGKRTYTQGARILGTVIKAVMKWRLLVVKKKKPTRAVSEILPSEKQFYEDADFSTAYLQKITDVFFVSGLQTKEKSLDAQNKYVNLQTFTHEITVTWPIPGSDGYYPVRKFSVLKMRGRGDSVLQAMSDEIGRAHV